VRLSTSAATQTALPAGLALSAPAAEACGGGGEDAREHRRVVARRKGSLAALGRAQTGAPPGGSFRTEASRQPRRCTGAHASPARAGRQPGPGSPPVRGDSRSAPCARSGRGGAVGQPTELLARLAANARRRQVRRRRSVAAHARRGVAPSSPAGGVARRSDSVVRAFAVGDAKQGARAGSAGAAEACGGGGGTDARGTSLAAEGGARLVISRSTGPLAPQRKCPEAPTPGAAAAAARRRGPARTPVQLGSLVRVARQHERAVRAADAKQLAVGSC
jgi:hypothetical protein